MLRLGKNYNFIFAHSKHSCHTKQNFSLVFQGDIFKYSGISVIRPSRGLKIWT